MCGFCCCISDNVCELDAMQDQAKCLLQLRKAFWLADIQFNG
ncbi:hypothetical protein HMPREF1872_00293 [Amygdalobacter nucleatus]|uniref:Uncharacterized protein n=1 Tax=Amygdalobacter nucleatus TaxID=3029274 RepID=A0A133YHC7_9FIRM|nr:hypothetical protein HMPREF1872_00293 [Amygdalobacter nucleatus]